MAVYESHLAGGKDLSVQEGIIYIQALRPTGPVQIKNMAE